jgi:hypothetical protein
LDIVRELVVVTVVRDIVLEEFLEFAVKHID